MMIMAYASLALLFAAGDDCGVWLGPEVADFICGHSYGELGGSAWRIPAAASDRQKYSSNGFPPTLLMLAFGSRFLPESWSDALAPLMTMDGVVRGAFWGAGVLAVLAAALLVLLALQQDRTKEANE
jgi:hypothetical protein